MALFPDGDDEGAVALVNAPTGNGFVSFGCGRVAPRLMAATIRHYPLSTAVDEAVGTACGKVRAASRLATSSGAADLRGSLPAGHETGVVRSPLTSWT